MPRFRTITQGEHPRPATNASSIELSNPTYNHTEGKHGRLAIVAALVLACLCLAFDSAEISRVRDDVLDDDYQTELPQFTDAAPESPLDFLDDDEDQCNPESDPSCEAPEQHGKSGETPRSERGDGDSDRSSGDEVTDGSDSGEQSGAGTTSGGDSGQKSPSGSGKDGDASGTGSFWDHEAEFEPPEPSEPPEFDLPDGLLAVLQVLGITILVVIVLLIIWRIARALSDRSDLADESDLEKETRTTGSLRQNAPTRPHEELAEQTHYDEAIHRLLLEVIELLSDRQPGLSSPALTARELLRRVRLDDKSHQHLTALVRAVEEILFARRPADEDKYQACLSHHRQIMQALDQTGGLR